ncbi:MAG: multiheme c-type cytochrome [Verrucomicrobiia bacterium]
MRNNQKRITGSPLCQQTLAVAAVMFLMTASLAPIQAADDSYKIVRTPGGISPSPVVTSVSKATGDTPGINVEWQGFGGPYNVMKCPGITSGKAEWQTIATFTNETSATFAMDSEIGLFEIQAPDPAFAGAERCSLCHLDTHETWMNTHHSKALETLKAIKQDKNATCLPCHTVGYKTSTGFIDEVTTPGLAGVQCENCHGPAAEHARRPRDQKTRPIATAAAEMCGGCHSDAHHPTYDEWARSGHASLEIPEEEFADPIAGPPRMSTCGACHSGATRLAMLTALEYNEDPPVMPSTHEAASTGITCAVCHDAHAMTGHPAQLRFPVHSEKPYSYSTAKSFAENFDPEVQTCAQCHNARGASWRGTSRPPHHSPQYNVLIGDGGWVGDATEIPQSAHMKIQEQCAQCHTHAHEANPVTEETPNYTGHEFRPTLFGCAPCHDEIGGELLTEVVQENTKEQIAEIKGLLDDWALTKAPEALSQKYGVLAWEFQNIGQLSTPTPEVPRGPSADEQAAVPDAIKQARHNLYLVEHDGSYGVHNGNYSRFLLKVARDQVRAELGR